MTSLRSPVSPASVESSDPEFDEMNRKMTAIESSMEKFVKDLKAFTGGVTGKWSI